VDFCGLLWTFVDFCGLLWTFVDFCGLLWTFVDFFAFCDFFWKCFGSFLAFLLFFSNPNLVWTI
jgi:hypothetical protein